MIAAMARGDWPFPSLRIRAERFNLDILAEEDEPIARACSSTVSERCKARAYCHHIEFLTAFLGTERRFDSNPAPPPKRTRHWCLGLCEPLRVQPLEFLLNQTEDATVLAR